MYSTDGDFGQVRLDHRNAQGSDALFTVDSVGWHKCNDLYRIERPEGHPFHLLIVTVEGCGSMTLCGETYALPAGTVALIPRGMPNSYKTPKDGSWEFYWLHPSHGASEVFLDSVAHSGVFVRKFSPAKNYSEVFEDILSLCSIHSAEVDLRISQKTARLLHFAALDLLSDDGAPTLAERAVTFIESNHAKDISLSHIADALFVSQTHLIRVFKKELGCTPHAYLVAYRLRTAAQFLKYSRLRTAEIARIVGFSSSSQFINSFKHTYGITPTKFRAENGTKEPTYEK